MPDENRNVCLALMAHPDDAEFLCAGTLARLASIGWQIHIATMTAGDCGSAQFSASMISALRKSEATKAAGLIKASYVCLDELDGFVCYDKPTLRKVVDHFRKVSPSIVITHAPRDYMMDHEHTSQLARAAAFLFSAPNASQYPLAPGARVPHLYFADPIEGIDHDGQLTNPSTVIRITDEMPKKLAMLACHESQMKWMREHNKADDPIHMIQRLAVERGRLIGAPKAEAFVQFLAHAHPSDDLLRQLLCTDTEAAEIARQRGATNQNNLRGDFTSEASATSTVIIPMTE